MAGKIEINRITNANIYVNGNSLLGRAEEIKLPDISAIMRSTRRSAWSARSSCRPASTNWRVRSSGTRCIRMWPRPWPIRTSLCSCSGRSSIETYGAQGRIQEVSLVTFLTVMFKKNPLGTFKQHDNAEFGSSFAATYIKQVIDGDEVLELDYMANIFRVGAEDMVADYRSNIGG